MSARHVAVSCSRAATAFQRQRLLFLNSTLLRLCLVLFLFFLMKQKCFPDRISLSKILKPLGFSQLLLKEDSLTLCSDSSHVLLSFLMVFFPNVYPNPLGNPTSSGPTRLDSWKNTSGSDLFPLSTLSQSSNCKLEQGHEEKHVGSDYAFLPFLLAF